MDELCDELVGYFVEMLLRLRQLVFDLRQRMAALNGKDPGKMHELTKLLDEQRFTEAAAQYNEIHNPWTDDVLDDIQNGDLAAGDAQTTYTLLRYADMLIVQGGVGLERAAQASKLFSLADSLYLEHSDSIEPLVDMDALIARWKEGMAARETYNASGEGFYRIFYGNFYA